MEGLIRANNPLWNSQTIDSNEDSQGNVSMAELNK